MMLLLHNDPFTGGSITYIAMPTRLFNPCKNNIGTGTKIDLV